MVCADADGQHTVTDILAVVARLAVALDGGDGNEFVLDGRYSRCGAPVRSRVGNAATRLLFRLITGVRVRDTQTGLRGYPAALQRVRTECAACGTAAGRRLVSVPIATVCREGIAWSHVRPLADSIRGYAPLLKFGASSLTSWVVDAAGVLYLYSLTGSLLISVVGARAVSSAVNYLINRRLVFREDRDRPASRSALRYGALLVAMLAANWAMLLVITGMGVALLPAKIITDLSLFVVNYSLQHRVVFASGRRVVADDAAIAFGEASGRAS